MKVGVVGAGSVGAAAAFAIALRGVASEIILVDVDERRARAEAEDIAHATPFTARVRISADDFEGLEGAGVVVIAAGRNQHVGQSRLSLVTDNAEVISDIVPRVLEIAPDAILVVATNPVDPMTQLAQTLAIAAGKDERTVFGTGTTLDTARFRHAIARHVDVDAQHVHAYVLGEHGDSEVLAWSAAMVAGNPVEVFAQGSGRASTRADRAAIEGEVVGAAQRIIAGKGATAYGVGAAIAKIVEVVSVGQRAILTVTATHPRWGCALSLPRVVSERGIVREITLALSSDEQRALERSAEILRSAAARLGP